MHLEEILRNVDSLKIYLGLRHLRELLSHQESPFFFQCVMVAQAQAASMFFVMKVSCHDATKLPWKATGHSTKPQYGILLNQQ